MNDRRTLSIRGPLIVAEAVGGLDQRRDIIGQLHREQVARERRGRLAIAHHEANGASRDRLDEVEQDVAHRAARLYRFDERRYKKLVKQGFNFEI